MLYQTEIPLNDLSQASTSQEVFPRPSRILSGHRKFKTYGGPLGDLDSGANRIVAQLEENEALMEDTPLSEELRKEALRELPQCLTMKRCVKLKLSKSVSLKSRRRPISFWKSTKYRFSISWNKFVGGLKHFNFFRLWHGTLKDIEGRFGSGYASYFKFLRWLLVMNFLVGVFCLVVLVIPQVAFDARLTNLSYASGKDFLRNTVFSYAHYNSDFIFAGFHMPSAYFSITIVIYILSFIVLAVSVAGLYKRSFIETEGGLRNIYANRIFCGWDFTIATREAADLKSSSIYQELRELLTEELANYEKKTCLVKFWTFTIQLVVHLLVLVILGASGWVIWLLLEKFSSDDKYIVTTAIVANFLIMILPPAFSYLSKYEGYKSPRAALYITLFRTYLLGAMLLGVLMTFWLTRSASMNCWQNSVVTEIYLWTIFDFIFCVIFTVLFDLLLMMACMLTSSKGKTEFNVAKHTLQIIYNQGLFWVGLYYSPVLPLIVTLKMLIIWYVRELTLKRFCRPPKQSWRAAQTQTIFMTMTFVSILLVIALHLYTLRSAPASDCGPFENYNYTYEILMENIGNFEENDFGKVVMNVTKPGGVAIIMIGLIVFIYYAREQALASRKKVKMFRETLVWMAKDKKFLVQWYNEMYQTDLEVRSKLPRFSNNSLPKTADEELISRFKKYA